MEMDTHTGEDLKGAVDVKWFPAWEDELRDGEAKVSKGLSLVIGSS